MGVTAVALGLFDGVHLGHRAVLELAVKSGMEPSVFTFDADTVNSIKSSGGYIYSDDEKADILRNCGIVRTESAAFADICGMSGEEFVKNVLVGRMAAAFVSCGENFRFGHKASCGVSELRELGRRYGFEVRTAEDVEYEGEMVSSTAVRSFLADGDPVRARQFLGAPYTIRREVVHGAALGRTIGYPTLNQVFGRGQLVPRYGVYASRVCIGGETYRAMTNIGMKPTVNYGGMPLAETYIIGFSGDLYGRTVPVELCGYIRPEKRFSSVDELKKQITEDIRNILT